ncbi:MAG: serine/threonine protein phosphatase PrpC [Candidatus Azotimanducaceae bacterium]|jgi:serine/threonine protein phosphatase PrpC
MSMKGKLEFVCRTDVGQVRDHNEDYISYDAELGFSLLADGMGGLNAGEVASSMAVHLLMDDLTALKSGKSTLSAELDSDALGVPLSCRMIRHLVERANSAVFHVSQTQPQCRGMGTTIVVGMYEDNHLIVGHIGDSRVYRYRGSNLEQITRDHSYVQELIDKGLFTKEQARASDKKNVVTRALGVGPTVEVEVREYPVKVGDIYLMCSDGLTDLVTDEDIETTFRESKGNMNEIAGHLVNLANASGGKDNISVILTKVVKPFSTQEGLFEKIANWFE